MTSVRRSRGHRAGDTAERQPAERNATALLRVLGEEPVEVRAFMEAHWVAADLELFGPGTDWASSPIVVVARDRGRIIGAAVGEAIAGMARLNDLLVEPDHRDRGVGSRLVERFCTRARELGAARCFVRCPATERHVRFYRRQGFVEVARLERYYFGHDFLELVREPLEQPS